MTPKSIKCFLLYPSLKLQQTPGALNKRATADGPPLKPLPLPPRKSSKKVKLFRLSRNSMDPKISFPTNVSHELHVVFDAQTGEFKELLYLKRQNYVRLEGVLCSWAK
ncbi:Serine/threonine-protein kinase PAK 3 [Taenia solium]|eukprot:TsM_001063900 transcript=TsM_001063900 gene=TsM_001063900